MTFSNTDRDTDRIATLLKDLFEISAHYRHGNRIVFGLMPRYDQPRSLKLIRDRLKLAGYNFDLKEQKETILLTIDPKPKLTIPPLNIFLFLMTLLSIYFVPVFIKHLFSLEATLADLSQGAGLEFTAALVSILFVHEMGHFIASRRRDIITSWPYFIPAPNIIGTFGAIIKSKSPFWNRRDLIEVGAAGPIAGWLVAICWLVYGLSQSGLLSQAAFAPGQLAFSMEGESLIVRALTLSLIGPAGAEEFYIFTEAAFAGWVGMLVTAINLLPIGQLDGGHIIYGLIRKRQFYLGYIAMASLIYLGFQSPMWWMFAIFGLIFGVKHPPTINDAKPVSRTALWMAIISILIMLLSFTPVPFR